MEKLIKHLTSKATLHIKIEKLSPPDQLLSEISSKELVAKLGKEVHAISHLPSKLVDYGSHAFLGGMYQAYSDHRPFTISPEMIVRSREFFRPWRIREGKSRGSFHFHTLPWVPGKSWKATHTRKPRTSCLGGHWSPKATFAKINSG